MYIHTTDGLADLEEEGVEEEEKEGKISVLPPRTLLLLLRLTTSDSAHHRRPCQTHTHTSRTIHPSGKSLLCRGTVPVAACTGRKEEGEEETVFTLHTVSMRKEQDIVHFVLLSF